MIEFQLYGLNSRQQTLADIMWSLAEWEDVERFIASLPQREAAEAEAIIEMMRMAVVEQCYEDAVDEFPEADAVINKARRG